MNNNTTNTIEVRNTPQPVALAGGGTLYVKRLRRIQQENCRMLANRDAVNAEIRMQRLLVQSAIVNAEDLHDEDGKPVPYASLKDGLLGSIATMEIYAAIESDEDLRRILEIALGKANPGETSGSA